MKNITTLKPQMFTMAPNLVIGNVCTGCSCYPYNTFHACDNCMIVKALDRLYEYERYNLTPYMMKKKNIKPYNDRITEREHKYKIDNIAQTENMCIVMNHLREFEDTVIG